MASDVDIMNEYKDKGCGDLFPFTHLTSLEQVPRRQALDGGQTPGQPLRSTAGHCDRGAAEGARNAGWRGEVCKLTEEEHVLRFGDPEGKVGPAAEQFSAQLRPLAP